MTKKTRILLLDIETFPNIAYVWGKYDQNVIQFVQEGCIASFVAKWLDEPEIISKGLPDYKGYKAGSYDDKKLVADLWNLLDEADVVIAHYGSGFDIPYCNGRFLFHGLVPPSPYKIVDTKKAASKLAKFNSNKLDDLGAHLGLGQKIKTDFDLWKGCIAGDKNAWQRMLEYNRQDVLLLEQLYLRLRPWINDHPNLTVHSGAMCPKCNSNNVQMRGIAVTLTRRYQRFQCRDCGGWGRMVKSDGRTDVTNAV
jgi:hypothetical protein